MNIVELITSKSGKVHTLLFLLFFLTGWSHAHKNFDLGLCPLKDSDAYQRFSRRPVCELSKIQYLIDRFKDAPMDVNYDGHDYRLRNITGLVEMFVATHYDKDLSAKQWIMEYASRTLYKNNPIWVHQPNGAFYQTRDVLLQELGSLEKTLPAKDLPN